MSLLGNHGIVNSSGPLDPDAQAFITATGTSGNNNKNGINALVLALKGANSLLKNFWGISPCIYPMVDISASAHKFNLKDPRNLDAAYRLTYSGGNSHNGRGITFNGTDGQADTKLNPLTYFAARPLAWTTYVRSIANSGVMFGADVQQFDLSNTGSFRNGGNNVGTRPRWSLGVTTIGRVSGGNVFRVYNGYFSSGLAGDAFTSNGNLNWTLGASAVPGFWASVNVSFAMLTEEITEAEASVLHGIIETYEMTVFSNIKKFWIYGDSYVQGSVNGFDGWTAQVCFSKGLIEMNYGVYGSTIEDLDTNKAARIPVYNAQRDYGILICFGLNECGLNANTVAYYNGKLDSVLNYAINTLGWPASSIQVITGYFADAATWTAYGAGATDPRYVSFRNGYAATAALYGVATLDMFTQTNAADKSGDNVHYTAGGVSKAVTYLLTQV